MDRRTEGGITRPPAIVKKFGALKHSSEAASGAVQTTSDETEYYELFDNMPMTFLRQLSNDDFDSNVTYDGGGLENAGRLVDQQTVVGVVKEESNVNENKEIHSGDSVAEVSSSDSSIVSKVSLRKALKSLEGSDASSAALSTNLVSDVKQFDAHGAAYSARCDFTKEEHYNLFAFGRNNRSAVEVTPGDATSSSFLPTAGLLGGRKPNSKQPVPVKPLRRMKEPSLSVAFPPKCGAMELRILKQPEEQHRARYLTEGSRGTVKDQSQQSHPTVQLVGCDQAGLVLQVFVGSDVGKTKAHGFYQAVKVSNKNSTPCTEKDIEGTTVIEIALDPKQDMIAMVDCVGILKLRNADVEQRIGLAKSKKKSTYARLVFRVNIPKSDGTLLTLQVASHQILCTQPAGAPEICKKSLNSCTVKGQEEIFIIGKNFLKGTQVYFEQIHNDRIVWSKEADIDQDFFQVTHIVCTVPTFSRLDIHDPVDVQIVVHSSGRISEPVPFTYLPMINTVNIPMDVESQLNRPSLEAVGSGQPFLPSHSNNLHEQGGLKRTYTDRQTDTQRLVLTDSQTAVPLDMLHIVNRDDPSSHYVLAQPPPVGSFLTPGPTAVPLDVTGGLHVTPVSLLIGGHDLSGGIQLPEMNIKPEHMGEGSNSRPVGQMSGTLLTKQEDHWLDGSSDNKPVLSSSDNVTRFTRDEFPRVDYNSSYSTTLVYDTVFDNQIQANLTLISQNDSDLAQNHSFHSPGEGGGGGQQGDFPSSSSTLGGSAAQLDTVVLGENLGDPTVGSDSIEPFRKRKASLPRTEQLNMLLQIIQDNSSLTPVDPNNGVKDTGDSTGGEALWGGSGSTSMTGMQQIDSMKSLSDSETMRVDSSSDLMRDNVNSAVNISACPAQEFEIVHLQGATTGFHFAPESGTIQSDRGFSLSPPGSSLDVLQQIADPMLFNFNSDVISDSFITNTLPDLDKQANPSFVSLDPGVYSVGTERMRCSPAEDVGVLGKTEPSSSLVGGHTDHSGHTSKRSSRQGSVEDSRPGSVKSEDRYASPISQSFDGQMNHNEHVYHQISLNNDSVQFANNCTSQTVFESINDSSAIGRSSLRNGSAYPGNMITRTNQMFEEEQTYDSSIASSHIGHSPQVVHVHLHSMNDSVSSSAPGHMHSVNSSAPGHMHTAHRGHDIGVISSSQIPLSVENSGEQGSMGTNLQQSLSELESLRQQVSAAEAGRTQSPTHSTFTESSTTVSQIESNRYDTMGAMFVSVRSEIQDVKQQSDGGVMGGGGVEVVSTGYQPNFTSAHNRVAMSEWMGCVDPGPSRCEDLTKGSGVVTTVYPSMTVEQISEELCKLSEEKQVEMLDKLFSDQPIHTQSQQGHLTMSNNIHSHYRPHTLVTAPHTPHSLVTAHGLVQSQTSTHGLVQSQTGSLEGTTTGSPTSHTSQATDSTTHGLAWLLTRDRQQQQHNETTHGEMNQLQQLLHQQQQQQQHDYNYTVTGVKPMDVCRPVCERDQPMDITPYQQGAHDPYKTTLPSHTTPTLLATAVSNGTSAEKTLCESDKSGIVSSGNVCLPSTIPGSMPNSVPISSMPTMLYKLLTEDQQHAVNNKPDQQALFAAAVVDRRVSGDANRLSAEAQEMIRVVTTADVALPYLNADDIHRCLNSMPECSTD